MRHDNRKQDELRPVKITPSFLKHPAGSVLIEVGDTKVICAATVDNKVPPFMRGQKRGWVTAEYSLLPSSTEGRTIREAARGKISGRTHEIQRLIGRSLRSIIDLEALGERTLWLDCDVMQADGGTRTAAITGSFIALAQALYTIYKDEKMDKFPVTDFLGATSVGIIDKIPLLDLDYYEDSKAEVDMNVVITGKGNFIEVQGTAEGKPYTREELDRLLDLSDFGIKQLIAMQKDILGEEIVALITESTKGGGNREENDCSY